MTTTTPPSPSVNRSSAPPQKKFNAQEVKLVDAARHLYELGFNVIPVDSEKKPIGSWSADKRLGWEELQRRLAKASGIAITGRYLEDKDYGVAILDLDNVNEAKVRKCLGRCLVMSGRLGCVGSRGRFAA